MVDENRIEGAARNMGGKIQDAVGGPVGDTSQVRGTMNQGVGTAQNTLGSAADTASEWSGTVSDVVRENPLTALLVAMSAGFVVRMLTHSSRH